MEYVMMERISARDVITLAGDITSGSNTTIEQGNHNVLQKNSQPEISLLPKLFSPEKTGHKKRYNTIEDIKKKIRFTYFSPKKYMHMYCHMVVDNIKRQRRREIRNPICDIAQAIIHYYDVVTGKIGFTNERGKWINISYHAIAEFTGYSVRRILKVFKLFRERKWITIDRRYEERKDGRKRAIVAEKTLHPLFFVQALGADWWQKVKNLKEWMFKHYKAQSQHQKDNIKKLTSLIKDLAKPVVEYVAKPIINSQKLIKKIPEPKVYMDADRQRRLYDQSKYLFEKDPSKSQMEHYKALLAAGG